MDLWTKLIDIVINKNTKVKVMLLSLWIEHGAKSGRLEFLLECFTL